MPRDAFGSCAPDIPLLRTYLYYGHTYLARFRDVLCLNSPDWDTDIGRAITLLSRHPGFAPALL